MLLMMAQSLAQSRTLFPFQSLAVLANQMRQISDLPALGPSSHPSFGYFALQLRQLFETVGVVICAEV
jgi:hypothetical protein